MKPKRRKIHITKKEQQVINLLLMGLKNREIAGAMGVEIVTAKFHLGNLFKKYGVSSRDDLARRVRKSD